jgi:hypothetical protein
VKPLQRLYDGRFAGSNPVSKLSLVLPKRSRMLFYTVKSRNWQDGLAKAWRENGVRGGAAWNAAKTGRWEAQLFLAAFMSARAAPKKGATTDA